MRQRRGKTPGLIFVPDDRIHFFKVQRVIRTGGTLTGTMIEASSKLRMLD
jgi:hypothetical protein